MQLSIHDQTLKRVGFINNNLPDALHYFDDNWHRYLAEGTSTFDFSVNKINSSYALLTLQSYISFTYDGEDYLFNIINIEQDHYSMHLQCENLNLELISEEIGSYVNTKRHSIVWYLKNVAKITDDLVEIGNNPFPLVDEDVSNPILSFDNDETKLSRIISICKSFNAEFQFKTQLKNDGTLQNITIDLYEEGGVGQKRKDVTLYYGKNIAGIKSKADRTSTFFNATTVTDSKNKFNWLSVEGKYYNSDGQLEFYKNAGDNTAYAPLSRDMFPSQLKSSSSDRYTRKNLSIEATSANSLWDYAVSQFKLYANPQMTYEVSVAVNAVTSALGNDRKLDIGDTIIVQDNTFDKSEGGLILSARVSEQEISFTNPQSNKIIFTNFVRLKSDISSDLYGRMKELVDRNTPYRFEIASDNGLTFKNSTGSTTLTALVFKGSNVDEVSADNFEWLIDGVKFGGTANSQIVSASQVNDTAVVRYNAKVGDTVIGGIEVTLQDVSDGTNGISPTVTVNPDTSLTIVDAQGTSKTPVLKGSDGTSGIIVSSVAPTSPQTSQLWQDTSTTPQLVKKWTGSSWVIWELYVENMNVNNLSALSPNLGNITGGTYTSWDILVQETSDIPITRYYILKGVYIDNGLMRTISINTRNIINRVINENSTLQASEIESINGCEITSGKTTFYNTINNKEYDILNGLTPNEILQGIDSEGFTRPPGISYIEFYNNYNYNIGRGKYDVFFNVSSSYGMYSASLFTQPNFGGQGKTALSIHSAGHITIESPDNLIFGDLDVTGGIRQTSKTASVTIGAGLILSLERRGEMVIALLTGTINSSLTSGKQFSVGKIPLGYRPNTTANIPAHMTSSYNSAHIDAGIDGVCTWFGPTTSSGYPRGTQMWFTNDSLPN